MAQRRVALEVSLVALLGFAVVGSTLAIGQRDGEYAFFDQLIEVKSIIGERFAEQPNLDKLRDGAIKGMVEALDDPYTVYVPASEARNFNKDLTGEYVGIGAQIDKRDGWLTIVSPLEDSPAFRAGILANDRVKAIDGILTRDITAEKCIELLLGTPGTPVKLTIERDGNEFDLTINRERIKTRAIKGVHRDPANPEAWTFFIDHDAKIGYVRITQFTPGCANELAAALETMGASKGELKGLVLDVRFNPGGLLNEAEAIADLFLKEGIIVSTRGRAFEERITRAREPGTLPAFPIAVLINEQAASASEVLSGALVENNAAITVGTRTFGKGTVQSLHEIVGGKGAELKITEQGYYLPTGRSIQRKDDAVNWGVDPSEGFYVPLTDSALIEMLEVRRNEEIIRKAASSSVTTSPTSTTLSAPSATTNAPAIKPAIQAPDWNDVGAVLTYLKDPQLSAAVRAVQGKIISGEWTKTGEAGVSAEQSQLAELKRSRELITRLERELIKTEKRVVALEAGKPINAGATRDLIPNDANIQGGTLEIRDKDGKVVSTLKITGENLERWLIDADVEPANPAASTPATAPIETAPAETNPAPGNAP